MTEVAERIRITDIPIPDDVRPDRSWSQLLLEIAGIVGPRDALRLAEAIGGAEIYFPLGGPPAELVEILGAEKAAAMNIRFQRETIELPTAKMELARARRGSVIAAVREDKMTPRQGAAILNVQTSYMRQLVKRPEEGHDAVPLVIKRKVDPRQIDMFPDNND